MCASIVKWERKNTERFTEMSLLTRRSALAGITSSMAFGAKANSKVSFGIIGTGERGRVVGSMMARDPRGRLMAICDVFPDRLDLARTQVPGADEVKSFGDYRELLVQHSLDAVLIATPVFLHPEHFAAAVKAGKHVYCEKPAGADVAGVKRLLRAAEAASPAQSLAFGFQQRFSPEYIAAEQMIRSGAAGDLTQMSSFWMWGGNAFAAPPKTNRYAPQERRLRYWNVYRETSGDIIVEQDCHGVDVMNWFAGAHPVSASGAGGRKVRTFGDISDWFEITYEYAGGVRGMLHASQLPPAPFADVKEQFFGTKRVIETTRTYFAWMDAGKRDWHRTESKREITIDAVEAFFSSIVEKKPLNMTKSSAESTLTSILGRMAAETGRVVTWEEMLKAG